jgi:hypothetical protein
VHVILDRLIDKLDSGTWRHLAKAELVRADLKAVQTATFSQHPVTENEYTCDPQNVPMRLRSHTSVAPGRIDPLTRWQGLHEYENHRIPVGAMILDAKYCEFCGCNFLRRAQSKDRYCSKCLLTFPALRAQETEKLLSELVH